MVILVLVVVGVALLAQWGSKRLEGMTSQELSSKIANFTGLVVFKMTGCGHCDSLKKETDKLDKSHILEIERADPGAQELIDQFEVRGFPTMFFMRNGQKQKPPGSGVNGEYMGSRDAKTLEGYLETVVQGYEKIEAKPTSLFT